MMLRKCDQMSKWLTFGLESTSHEMFTTCLIAAFMTVDSAVQVGGSSEKKNYLEMKYF